MNTGYIYYRFLVHRLLFVFFSLLIHYNGNSQPLAKSLLWKVSGGNTKGDCYIYGTFHLGVKPTEKKLHQYDSLIKLCEAFYGEMNFDSVNQNSILKHAFLSGRTLESCFNPNDYKWVSRYLKDSFDTDINDYKKFKPAFIQTILAAMEVLKSDQVDDKSFSIDKELFTLAKSHHKIMRGFETDEDQAVILFDKHTVEEQATQLVKSLKGEKIVDTTITTKLFKYYREQDLEGLEKLAKQSEEEMDMNSLVDQRNSKWVDIFTKQCNQYTMYIAVGALHLPGDTGLLNLLKQKGYTVTPVFLN